MMQKVKQLQQAKEELENPHESDRIRAVAEMLAEIQRAMRAGVMDQRETLGIDPDDGVERMDHEQRTEDLLDVADAYLPGGPSLAEIWLDRCAPDHLDVQDTATLTNYAGLEADEWESQIQTWAEIYRSQDGNVSDVSDRYLAGLHVKAQWGVSLDHFKTLIVEWDRSRALRELLAGPSETTEEAIYNNTEELA
jgi:hypothetical protein